MTPITLEELRRYPPHHYIEYNGSDILVSDLIALFGKRTKRKGKERRKRNRKR